MEDNSVNIDWKKLARKLLAERKLIAISTIIAAVAGLIVAFSVVSTYTVVSKMAPEYAGGRASAGNLSSLANLAGINLNSMTSTSDAISPELYPDIVSSESFMSALFTMPVDARYKKDSIRCNYFEYRLNCQNKSWYGPIVSFPGKLIGWGIGLFLPSEEEPVKGFTPMGELDSEHLTRRQMKMINRMRDDIFVSVDKKSNVVTLYVTDQNPVIAKQLSDTIISGLKQFITDYRTGKSRNDLVYYERLCEEAKADYELAQQRYARYVDANQGVVRKSVMTEQERLQNEMSLKFQLYNSCAQQVQMSKAQVQRETPVCAVLQPPTVPVLDNESGFKILAIFIFLGFILSCLWVAWGRDGFDRLKSFLRSEGRDDD